MAWIQPTQAFLLECTINGFPYQDVGTNTNYFHVQELRIYEDHCKAYFTGQLVIETHQNVWEAFVHKGADVVIGFRAPRSDGGPTQDYYENFKIFSYESKPRQGDIEAAIVTTISLIGEEYYRDRYNTVSQAFSNIPGTAAAAAIHETYMSVNGGLQVQPESLGMIGLENVPHEVNNKKPIKAIHDILDKVVYASYPSCAAMYFRNKPGYVMSPLQYLLENAPVTETFVHKPAQAAFMGDTMAGYNRVNHLRPMNPPGEERTTASGGDISGIFQSLSFFDIKTGNFGENAGSGGGLPGMISKLGGRRLFSVIDDLHQNRSVAKNGPGNFQATEDAFLTALSYTNKYWVSVPMQTGVNVTCGTRITVIYPFSNQGNVTKTLYVPRLIHELKFTEGPQRTPVTVNGITDIFALEWGE